MTTTDKEFTANDSFENVKNSLLTGAWPVEWKNTPTQINMRDGSPKWAMDIMGEAKLQLALFLGKEHFDMLLHPDTWTKVEANCKTFEMKNGYKWRFTQTLHEAGWRQWQSVVQKKPIEGIKPKRFRYATHFWVSPDNEIFLGKLKLEGKHLPPIPPSTNVQILDK